MVKVVLGIDGGATKTEAAVLSYDGVLLALGQAGPSNPAALPINEVCSNISASVVNALRKINDNVEVAVLSLSMAGYLGGAWDSEIRNCLMSELGDYVKDARIYITEDIEAAHASAFLTGDGVIGILGTGSNFYGKYAGRRARVGGWGHLIDDEGGAYHIGALGLSTVVRSYDGRIGETILVKYALNQYSVSSIEELIAKVYSAKDVKGAIASFAKSVFDAAREGDREALSILRRETEEVALALTTVIKRLGALNLPIALMGGTYMANRDLWKPMIEEELSRLMGRQVTIGESLIRQSCAASVIPINTGERFSGDYLTNIVKSCSVKHE
ncbi:BadF/BadG/BcrA/BcrD ATPase family protein [Caldivirga maquilingensis]|uniref:ATPase BadF/BadG/BcrA/BcrD type n=1 Tax=Caldivirga maquilingensis (strain ATCC 700844 / DSM 13496 / JCM 10307 / IC-167) TaxID=397948 RepID=A8MA19_CALMQ|nr:BadF/BadG/BcrA/BcrD ATPase family protein [Caldivirga maquilingensis]ABW02490.1 ATPase BadF/BadG/BcrA/BcrD type [Caldivirga maquilingensis IC-167]